MSGNREITRLDPTSFMSSCSWQEHHREGSEKPCWLRAPTRLAHFGTLGHWADIPEKGLQAGRREATSQSSSGVAGVPLDVGAKPNLHARVDVTRPHSNVITAEGRALTKEAMADPDTKSHSPLVYSDLCLRNWFHDVLSPWQGWDTG